MKNSKFIFVPMLLTSVFIFTPLTVNAEESSSSNDDYANITEEISEPPANENNTYTEENAFPNETSVENQQKSGEEKTYQETTVPEPEAVKSNAEVTEKQNEEVLQSESDQKLNSTEEIQKSQVLNDDSIETQENESSQDEIERPLNEKQSTELSSEKFPGTTSSEEEANVPNTDNTSNNAASPTSETDEVENIENDLSSQEDKENTSDQTSNKNDGSINSEENANPPSESDSSVNSKADIIEEKTNDSIEPDSSGNNKNSVKDNISVDENEQKNQSEKENLERLNENHKNDEKIVKDNSSTDNSVDENKQKDPPEKAHPERLNEDQKDEVENPEKSTVTEIKPFRLSADKSIKMFSLDTTAKNVKPVVKDAQYAARFTDEKHSGLYSPVTNSQGVSLDFIDDKTVYISQQAKYDGTTYYRVHKNLGGAMQGWVKEKDLRLFRLTDSVKHSKDYAINRDNEHLLTNPWGTSEQTVKRLDKYDTKLFRAEERLELGVLTFYYGKIDNDYGWLADSRLKAASTPRVTKENYAAKLNTNKNSGLYSPVTSREANSLNSLKDKTLYITQKADYNGTIFYRVHQNYDGAMQGWIQKEDLDLWSLGSPVTHKKDYSIARKNQYLLTNPWGSSKQTVKRLSSYGNSLFKAEKKLDLGVLTYYYGKIGKDYGWLEETRIKDATPVVTSARFAARVNGGNNSGIFSPVTSKTGEKMDVIQNQTLYITQKATYNGTAFYRVHSNLGGAMQGWIKEKDLDLYKLTNPVTHNKKYTAGRKNEYLLTNPWGTSYQRIAQLSKYGNSVFQAQKSLKLGLLTFYYGKIGNDYGWIQDNRLDVYKPVAPSPSPTVKTVKYNQSFNQVLNTQMNLSSKPQAWANGGGWRNATRNEVSRFLDTSHQTSDTWMYTFLDLDRAQNINSSTINSKLLSGKGTLNSQGSAFLNASKTHGINEVYLISHALHETGNGTSTLAKGVRLDSNGNISSNGKKYYNMYGIAAYDYNPVLGGARYAQQMGWDTPAKAIIGGAQFISQSYFNRGQTTLYSMRWNPSNPGTYQYATDVNWAYATAQNLRNYYRQLGIRGQYYTKHIF